MQGRVATSVRAWLWANLRMAAAASASFAARWRAYTAMIAAAPAAWRHEPHSVTNVMPHGVRLMPFSEPMWLSAK